MTGSNFFIDVALSYRYLTTDLKFDVGGKGVRRAINFSSAWRDYLE